jgi:hypothetical protein
VGVPPYTPMDVDEGFERELRMAWWGEAARADARAVPADADRLVRMPGSAQAALRALSGSRFFAKLVMRAMVSDLKQVRRCLTETELRWHVRDHAVGLIDADTRVLVGHSLGPAVAFEALCEYRLAAGAAQGPAVVTVGSPLGIPNLVFVRLTPPRPYGWGRGRARKGRRGRMWPIPLMWWLW